MAKLATSVIAFLAGFWGLAAPSARAEAARDQPAGEIHSVPELSSHLVNVEKCARDGIDGPRRCNEVIGYSVIETESELSDFRVVVSQKESFQTFLEPNNCPAVR